MLLSTNTAGTEHTLGIDKTIRFIAEAGFDAVDVSVSNMMGDENAVFGGKDYEKQALRIRKMCDDLGIVCNQTHTVFPTSSADPVKHEILFDKVIKGIEISGILGAKNAIVHPMQHLYYLDAGNPEILFEMNKEFYSRILPIAEKCGVNIATENMWQNSKFDKHIVESTCAAPEEFCRYIDCQNDPHMVACLDIGHCTLVGRNPEDFIRILGHDRLKALHIHDNDGKQDNHVFPRIPWIHSVNWDAVSKALAEIDYDGDFTFETDYMYKYVNDNTAPALFKYAHDLGRDMMRCIEEYRQNIK